MTPLRLLRRDAAAVVGLLVIFATALAAVLAPVLSPADPVKNQLLERLTPPMWVAGGTARHPLGTDTLGRDVTSRLLYGARVSLVVGVSAVAIAGLVGVVLGLLAGYYRGWPDDLLMRIGDVQLAFPVLVLAIALLAVTGASLLTVVLVLGVTGWITYARIVRGETLSLVTREFVEAARAMGAPDHHVIWRHIVPNVLPPITVVATVLRGARHHRRGVAQLPRARHPAARAQLGRHARRRPQLSHHRMVARSFPRPRHPGAGARHQPGG